ncbi:hypothetical protein EDD16DRAFT_1717976 [Pisolithus croceorrhizus]|nr:hypothetical protein EDD16DRAFT_1717976 [Pisolithus croceorrhizus]KAI6103859.1 hypothetical protein EV401DRAFT_2079375 [Pisolithus croceorrhizus]KAI6151444.1 hypothetical protein EDD17DRAFT_1765668 [Pisolithus thermaeus]
MDHILERPPLHSKSSGDEEQPSGDDDGTLDWTKLAKHVPGHSVTPERGEKDFEPVHRRDSDLQLHVLDQARGAMFETLRPQRGIPSQDRDGVLLRLSQQIRKLQCLVSLCRLSSRRDTHRVQFASMGHPISRASGLFGSMEAELGKNCKTEKRLDLLPEEDVIEREESRGKNPRRANDGSASIRRNDRP